MSSTAGLTVTEKAGSLKKLDMQALIEQAVANNAGVETLERIFSLAKDVRAEQAKEAWNRAMVAFQKACPTISKNGKASIQAGSGRFSYTYATLDSVMSAITPIMTELDLSISWRHRVEANKVTANCRVSHGLGHYEESGEVGMPIGEDRSGANAAQKVGIALTYAKRYSLLSIVGIAPEDDPDAQGVSENAYAKAESSDRFKDPVSDADEGEHETHPHGEYPGKDEADVISEAQHKRMWAMAFTFAKKEGMDKDWAKTKLVNVCRDHGFGNTKLVTMDKYKAICANFEVLPF